MKPRTLFHLVLLTALAADKLLPALTLATIVRRLAFGYVIIDLVLRARAGYLRRRSYWTRESWRRYLLACSIPVGALLLVFGIAWAVDLRLSIVGASGSVMRGTFVAVAVVCVLVFMFGLWIALDWLTEGEPARQFTWRRSG
jgi:hypothetical protein